MSAPQSVDDLKPSRRPALSSLGMATALVWEASPKRASLMLAIQVAASVSLLLQVFLVSRTLSAVLELGNGSGSLGRAVLPILLLAVVTALTAAIANIDSLYQRVLAELVAREVWRRVLTVAESVDLDAYEDPTFYDQADRVQGHAANQTQLVVQALAILIGDGLGMAASAVAILTLAPSLFLVLLLSGVPLFITSKISGRREFRFATEQSSQARKRTYLQQVLTQRANATELRAYDLATTIRNAWEQNYSAFLADLQRHIGWRVRLSLLGNLGSALLTSAAMLVAILLVKSGSLSLASAGAALVAIRLLGGRVGGVNLGIGAIMESSLFLSDLHSYLDMGSSHRRRHSSVEAPMNFQTIALSNVTFSYPKAPSAALRDVSMTIRRGEFVALVGENGSGKTTLAKLLANLHLPDKGTITWDGADLRTFDPYTVRQHIAVMFQDFVRYKLSARDNIRLGRPRDSTESLIRAAARSADADTFLARLPAGYDTILSKEYDGGTELSLGQWQRVALARTFLRDAPLVILDEPSAALDSRAERALFERIRSLLAGRTVLVISHRFSTVRLADRILVLSDGRIIEQGDHSSLMLREGLYAELFRLQASGYAEEGRTDA